MGENVQKVETYTNRVVTGYLISTNCTNSVPGQYKPRTILRVKLLEQAVQPVENTTQGTLIHIKSVHGTALPSVFSYSFTYRGERVGGQLPRPCTVQCRSARHRWAAVHMYSTLREVLIEASMQDLLVSS
jgi:hypothetical protein